jgi:hypothetical protein
MLSDSEQTVLYRCLWTTIKSGGSKTWVDLVATVAVIKNERNSTQYVASGFVPNSSDSVVIRVFGSSAVEPHQWVVRTTNAGTV